jgi:hypothetical protein
MPHDRAISIGSDMGVPGFRASLAAQGRIEALMEKQNGSGLSPDADQALRRHEEIDDYLNHLNRLRRNLAAVPPGRP